MRNPYLDDIRRHSEEARKYTPASGKRPVSAPDEHIKNTISLFETLMSQENNFNDPKHGILSGEIRKLIYSLVNHLSRLGRQGYLLAEEVQLLSNHLATIGVKDWEPAKRVAWCKKCNHHPLYSDSHRVCPACAGMICPNCYSCFQNASCPKRQRSEEMEAEIPF